jgi:hypothetical protein
VLRICFRTALVSAAVLMTAALLASFVRGADRPRGKKYALLVGVKDYRHSKFPNLKYTENDVEGLAEILNRKKTRFDAITVLTTTRGRARASARPTARNIAAALKALLARKSKHDTLLVALSGHGLHLRGPKGKGKDQSYFCPSDADPGDPSTLVGLSHLMDRLDRCGAGVKLLLVDACRNELGGEKSLDADSIKPARGIAALFSCSAGQKSHESGRLGKKGHGLFFHYVLKGIGGEAVNEDGEVTWDDLTAYVKRQVPKAALKIIGDGAQQSPHLVSNLVNSPVLARIGKGDRPKGGDKKPDPGERKLEAMAGSARAARWLRANVPAGIVKALAEKINKDLETYNGVTIRLGANRTDSGKAYCLELWAGEFFAFPLSEKQARQLKVARRDVHYLRRAEGLDQRVTPRRISLGEVTFDGGTTLSRKKRITGKVVCRVTTAPGEKVALRLSHSAGGGTVGKFYPLARELKKGNHTLRFSFAAIGNARADAADTGPLIVFLDLCRINPIRRAATLLSNTRAVLVDVVGDADPP